MIHDPDCLEGPGRTREEMAADARALDATASTPADKFALMFGHHEKAMIEPAPANEPNSAVCPQCNGLGGYPKCGTCMNQPPATEAKGCEGETPLTDKAQYMVRLGKHRRWVVRPELARDLERKLGEADKARRVLEDAADHLNARLREEKAKLGEATNVMRAATVLIAAKGRHNTMLAYNGLREALARIDAPLTPNPESRNVTP